MLRPVLTGIALVLVPTLLAQAPSFELSAQFRIGVGFTGPISVATADFNGDNVQDLVVGDLDGEAITVILGKGDGTFETYRRISVDAQVRQVAAADLDGDGLIDIAVVATAPNVLVLLKGKGDGDFEPPIRFDLASAGMAIFAADLNADGIADLVVGQEQGVLIAFGNRDLAFQPVNVELATQPVAIRSADLNKDGFADLAIAGVDAVNFGAGSVAILLGGADGSFHLNSQIKLGRPADLAIGDFNNDGNLDIVAASRYYSVYFTVLGNGDGTFQSPAPVEFPDAPLAVAAVDLNGDGIADIVLGNYYGGKVTPMLSNGDGTFRRMPDIQAKGDTFALAIADVNGDGIPDVIGANHSSRSVVIATGLGDGHFQPAVHLGSAPVFVDAVANPEGPPALAVANSLDDSVVIVRDGAQQTYAAGRSPKQVAWGDFNGDGIPDVAALNSDSGDVSILFGHEDGTFEKAPNIPVGQYPLTLVVADFNGDGVSDMLVTLAFEDAVVFVNNKPVGRIAGTASCGSIAVADFNRDGVLDLAVSTGSSQAGLRILLGKGSGLFEPGASFTFDGFPGEVSAADINGDGIPDIAYSLGLSVVALLGNGDGSFQPAQPAQGPAPGMGTYNGMDLADFDGDGKIDIAVVTIAGPMLLPGNGDGTFRSPSSFGIGPGVLFLKGFDWNGDGWADLITVERDRGTVSAWTRR